MSVIVYPAINGAALVSGSGGSISPDVLGARAGAVFLCHQSPAPLNLSHSGDRLLLLYTFSSPPIAGRSTTLRAGGYALFPCGEPVEIHQRDPVEILAISYDEDPRLEQAALSGPADAGMQVLAKEVRRTLRHEGTSNPPYLEALAQALLHRVARAEAPQQTGPREALTPATLRRVRAYVEARLGEPLSVSELAGVAGCSVGHFSRAFRQTAGEPPHRFVLRLRLERVRAQLEGGSEDLTTIAIRCGFSSHAHMTSAFGQAFGLTPSAYRRTTASGPRASGPAALPAHLAAAA